jgi:hypothetical protein
MLYGRLSRGHKGSILFYGSPLFRRDASERLGRVPRPLLGWQWPALPDTNQLHTWLFNPGSTEPLGPYQQRAAISKSYSSALRQWAGVSNTKCVRGRNASTTEFWMMRAMKSLCLRIKLTNQANQASHRAISHVLSQPVKKMWQSSPTYQIVSSYLPSLCHKC